MTCTRPLLWAASLAVLGGCAGRPPAPPPGAPAPGAGAAVSRIGYSVQVGAFSQLENAVRSKEALDEGGLDAFHFLGDDGLYHVRFGSFVSRELAADRAEALRQRGVIDDFYVVPPEPPGAATRLQIVRSALGFLGTPYRWGGPSAQTGFDCSGLVMTSYRLSGLALPRTSREQYAGGVPVRQGGLREADLVFFATEGAQVPSHVGIYIGDGRFVHAPGSGGTVRIDELSSGYYHRHYLSGRSYLE